jgi:Rod binding domain-containing protein
MPDGLAAIGPLEWQGTPAGKGGEPGRAKQAAGEFESLLVGEVLKTARGADGSGGWLGTGDDQAGAPMGEFAEQALAQVLTQQGGFGLRAIIERGLQAQRETSAPAPAGS